MTPLVAKTKVKGFLVIMVMVWGLSCLVSLPMGVYSRMVSSSE
jgi:hypothetical protein